MGNVEIATAVILGAGARFDEPFELGEGYRISPISIELDHHELEQHTVSRKEYGIICSIAPQLSFEFSIEGKDAEEAAILGWNAQWDLAFLSIVIQKPIFFPVSRTNKKDGSELYSLSNMFINSRIYEPPHLVTKAELTKFVSNIDAFRSIENVRLQYAVSVASNLHLQPSPALRIASIWSGIEALLNVDHELSFRISLLCAKIFGTDEESREKVFKETKKLYNVRSTCVHGSTERIKRLDLGKEIEKSLDLLCKLILHFVNNEQLFEDDQMAGLLFR